MRCRLAVVVNKFESPSGAVAWLMVGLVTTHSGKTTTQSYAKIFIVISYSKKANFSATSSIFNKMKESADLIPERWILGLCGVRPWIRLFKTSLSLFLAFAGRPFGITSNSYLNTSSFMTFCNTGPRMEPYWTPEVM